MVFGGYCSQVVPKLFPILSKRERAMRVQGWVQGWTIRGSIRLARMNDDTLVEVAQRTGLAEATQGKTGPSRTYETYDSKATFETSFDVVYRVVQDIIHKDWHVSIKGEPPLFEVRNLKFKRLLDL